MQCNSVCVSTELHAFDFVDFEGIAIKCERRSDLVDIPRPWIVLWLVSWTVFRPDLRFESDSVLVVLKQLDLDAIGVS